MALAVTVNTSKNPIEATAVSDKRRLEVTVAAAGETATGTAVFPITFTEEGHTWTKKSDDGETAVYTRS